MRRNQRRFVWLGVSILGVLTLSPALLAQASPGAEADAGVPTDWTSHHVIFSTPGSAAQAERVQQDPRYWHQMYRQSPLRLPAAQAASRLEPGATVTGKKHQLNRDWSQDLGSGGTVGAGNYPAKFSFGSDNASCNDFVVYGTGLLGSATQANIVAYNNLYSGCGGTVPSVYWAYNTIAGTVVTSPIFSKDGTQVAFVQSGGGFKSTLVLLKWAASTTQSIGSPLTLTSSARNLYPTCVAPCMTFVTPRTPGGVHDLDTNSSVFYDYTNDAAYVGDDAGVLSKYTPFFKGTPTRVTTGGWPVQVSSTALTSPVHDGFTGNIFVADKGGFLYWVDSTTAAVTQSGQLDVSSEFDSGPGIVEGPIVDSTAGIVYVFATSDGSHGCVGGADCSVVFQFNTTFTPGDVGPRAIVGASTVEPAAPSPLYIGAFDSTYENSADPPAGNLYVCGNTGGDPVLYQVAVAAGSFGTVTPGPVLSTSLAATPCSPVTDVLNPNASGGATEWMFASAENGGASSGCASGGCIFNFKDTPWLPLTAYTVGQEVLDSNFQIQVVVSVFGASGATAPNWSKTVGGLTVDGLVVWLDQGVQSAFTPAAWASGTFYSKGSKILDGNGNIQLATTAGTSGSTMPTFSAIAGVTTIDSVPLVWTNVGALGTAALAATGGTSGIILDNTVGSATEPGASQVYFSTLSDQVCGTSGTGGCAVQASQSALK
jgi:hypothetical protein